MNVKALAIHAKAAAYVSGGIIRMAVSFPA